jgi:peptidoglycan/xylan/chitin deacetylase (PgdA/CDA1 family)
VTGDDRAEHDRQRRVVSRRGLVALTAGAAAAGVAARGLSRPAGADTPTVASHGPFGTLEIIWSVTVDEPLVALTFDDGPDPAFTPRVLDTLARHGVAATFLMMGWNAARHPDLARAVVAAGHEIGHHSWSHLDLGRCDPDTAFDEVRRGRAEIARVTGVEPRWFRPPRGVLTDVGIRCAAEHGDGILMWTLNGGAPNLITPQALADRILDRVSPGTIVGLHDGIGRTTFDRGAPLGRELTARRTAEIDALDAVLVRLDAAGYRCVTASELVAAAAAGPEV